MPRLPLISSAAHRGWCAPAVLLLAIVQAHAQYDPDWTRNFRLGVLAGFNIHATFKTSGTLTISGNNPGLTNTPGLNHFFDDGYVRVDDFNNSGGYTTYWGYKDASQVSGQTLLYHNTSSFTPSAATGSSEKGEAGYAGLELAYGGYPWRWERIRLGWELGFGWLPISITDKSTIQGTAAQSTYSFDIPNGVVLPGAPYNGGSSGFGQPSIRDISTLVNSTNVPGTITGSRTLDVNLFALRLGPSLYWDVSRQIGVSVGAGPAVGIVSGDLKFDEQVSAGGTSGPNRGSVSATDVVFGGYINAAVMYHAVQNGDFYLGVQYMPMGNARISGRGREANLNLSGAVYISAGINWPF